MNTLRTKQQRIDRIKQLIRMEQKNNPNAKPGSDSYQQQQAWRAMLHRLETKWP